MRSWQKNSFGWLRLAGGCLVMVCLLVGCPGGFEKKEDGGQEPVPSGSSEWDAMKWDLDPWG